MRELRIDAAVSGVIVAILLKIICNALAARMMPIVSSSFCASISCFIEDVHLVLKWASFQVLGAKAADGEAMVDLTVSLVQTGFYQGLRTKGC